MNEILHILKGVPLCVLFILLTERTWEIRLRMYVFLLLFRCVYFRPRKWAVRCETSREYLKHTGKNGKVIPSHLIKADTGVEVQLHSTLMLARNGDDCSAVRHDYITTMDRRSVINEYEVK
jgi:hypothetical protein